MFEIVGLNRCDARHPLELQKTVAELALGLIGDSTARAFVLHLALAFTPAAVVGLLFGNAIKAHLFNPNAVAAALIVGGVVMVWAEGRPHRVSVPVLRISHGITHCGLDAHSVSL